MNSRASDPVHLRMPPEHFYWAVLDTTVLNGKWHARKELHYLLEPLLPIPLSEVHAVYNRIDDSRILACAMEKRRLENPQIAAALTLGPDHLPEELDIGGQQLEPINLLTGCHEPKPVRALRMRIKTHMFAALGLLTVLLIIGFERRRSQSLESVSLMESSLGSIHREILGDRVQSSVQPPQVLMLAERRRFEQTRSDQAESSMEVVDVTDDLQALLARWPNDSHVTTEMISITPATITVRTTLPPDNIEQAAASFKVWNNWRRAQPEIANQRDASILTIRFMQDEPGARL